MPELKSNPIIIVGMHRSGTTLITKILEQSGCFFGNKKFMGKNNESYFFMDLNKWLLKQYSASWDNPLPFLNYLEPDNNIINQYIDNYLTKWIDSYRKYKYFGLKKVSIIKHWGWKDPRNTITLPVWINMFPEAKIIYVYRNGIDIANSLNLRKKKVDEMLRNKKTKLLSGFFRNKQKELPFSQSGRIVSLSSAFVLYLEYQKLWNYYNNIIDNNNVFVIKFEDFLIDTEKHLSNLYSFLGISENQLGKVIKNVKVDKSRKFSYRRDEKFIEFISDNKKLLARDILYDYK